MSQSAWDDLREDARTFSRQNPETGHTLIFVSDRNAEGASRIDSYSGRFDDFITGAINSEKLLRELGIGGVDSRILFSKQCEIREGEGFVAEWLWCNPVGGTIHPNDEPGRAWPRLCAALWRLIVDRVGVLIPDAIKGGEADVPNIGTDPNTPDAARLLHWLAWSGQVDGLMANVYWPRFFYPTEDSHLTGVPRTARSKQVSPFSTGRPVRPNPIPNKPWLKLAGWWWSTIEPAGEALVAVIDWLSTTDAEDGDVEAKADEKEGKGKQDRSDPLDVHKPKVVVQEKSKEPTEPELNETETYIVEALRENGKRLTTDPLLKKALGKMNSHGKQVLSSLVKRKIIDNKRDGIEKGYGLPEWS